eukprot:evm.model.scf_133.2 EVM.evm.TU.scf_133.2   scf_133:84854-88450(+)
MKRRKARVADSVSMQATLMLAVFMVTIAACSNAEGWKAAPLGRFPAIVKLSVGDRWCSGVIIEAWHVLTSADCASAMGPRDMVMVRLSGNEQEFAVWSSTVHPRWLETRACAFDVAILRLQKPVAVKTSVLATSARDSLVSKMVYVYKPGDVPKVAPVTVVAHGPEHCPGLVGAGGGAFCVWMKAGNLTSDSVGGPVFVLDLPPGFEGMTSARVMSLGDSEMDMVVGILSSVDALSDMGGSTGCVAEISALIKWINQVSKVRHAKEYSAH